MRSLSDKGSRAPGFGFLRPLGIDWPKEVPKMPLLKTCPECLGDMTVEAIPGGMDGLCIMCGYRSPAEARPGGLAWDRVPASMTAAQRDWPYPSHQLRPARP